MYEMTEKTENFAGINTEKKYNKKKNYNRNFKSEEKVEAEMENIEAVETVENPAVVEIEEEKKPVEAKRLTKGTVVCLGEYAAMVKIGEKNFVMKPEFVNCKVGDIVEF